MKFIIKSHLVSEEKIIQPVDHEVLDRISSADFKPQRKLINLAKEQLGTVGSGNHFVDFLKMMTDFYGLVFILVHADSDTEQQWDLLHFAKFIL